MFCFACLDIDVIRVLNWHILPVGGNYLTFNVVEEPIIVQYTDKCHINEIILLKTITKFKTIQI